MKENVSRVVVILARGGSKRVPRKNLQLVGNKPLVLISAEVANECGYPTFVSSDDQEILDLKYPEKVTVYKRSAAHSGDLATSEEAILEIADHFSWANETEIILLPPTSPLRTAQHLKLFIEEWEKASQLHGYDQAISVLATKQDLWRLNGSSPSRIRNEISGSIQSRRSQERDDLFVETSAVYLSKLQTLRNGHKFTEGTVALIPLPKIASIDIDDFDDLVIARALYEKC